MARRGALVVHGTSDRRSGPGAEVPGIGGPGEGAWGHDERPAGDEPVEPEVHDEIPDQLDLPVEVPEADALEQELEVPLDDDER